MKNGVIISAINAKEVVVTFNKAVDVTTAETTTNYDFSEIVGSAIGANPTAAVVQADGKSVKLTLGTAITTETTFTTTVSGVKVKGSEYDYFPTFGVSTTFEDKVAPTVGEVTSLTSGSAATSLTVSFSEPIFNATFKVNGSVVAGTLSASGYSATISGLSLDVAKAHTLEVVNLTDFDSNVTAYTSKSFNVVKDVTTPNISLSTLSDNQILLTFDKKMDANTVNTTNIKVKNELLDDVVIAAPIVAAPGDTTGKKFVIDLPAGLYTSKNTRNFTVLLNDAVTDSLGNKLPTQFKNVSISKDTAAPTVSNVTFAKNPTTGNVDKVVVEFSEGLAASAGYSTAGITVISPSGVDVTAGFFAANTTAVSKGATKVEIPLTALVKTGKYTLYFGNGFVTDIAQNANNSVASTNVVDFGTSTTGEFTISQAALANTPSNTTNVITVNYGTVVKGGATAGSATDVNNYTLNGMPLPTGTLITLDPTLNIATITVPDETVLTTDTAAVIRISGVQNYAGTVITPFAGSVSVTDSAAPVLSTSVLNTNGTFTIGFGETLATPALLADFDVIVNGKTVNALQLNFSSGVGADAGKYVISVDGLVSDNATPMDATDDFLYVDVNNDGAYVAADDIRVTGAAAVAGVVDLNSAVFSTVTVKTKAAGPLTGADAAGNTLKLNVSKSVK
jgi:trimeric autotransporter adhesin